MLELDFGDMPGKLKEEYLDVYEGMQSEIISTTRFDENSDLSAKYLGKADRSKNSKRRRIIYSIKTRVHYGKTVRWNRMPNTIRYGSKQILHVKITLSAL